MPAPLPPPDPPSTAWRRHGAYLAGVAALGLFAYSSSLGGAFVYDDVRQIRDNPLVREPGALLTAEGYRAAATRWVGYLSFAFNRRLGGLDPRGFHALNLAIHLANAALVYALVVLTFRTPRLRGSALAGWSRAIGFAAAALFVAHPLQTQAVTYVVQRLTSLAATFFLLAVVLYAAWRLRAEAGAVRGAARVALPGAVVTSALLAMSTKEIAFTLPLAVAWWDLAFLEGTPRSRLARLAPVLATLPAVPLAWLWLRTRGGELADRVADATRVQSSVPRLDYLATQAGVVLRYLGLLLLPVGQNVDPDVPIQRALLAPGVLVPAAILAALAGAAAALWARTRPGARRPVDPAARLVAFGVAWFFTTVAVESSVIPIADVMNEHRAYLPSVGIFVAAAAGAAHLVQRLPRLGGQRTVALAGLATALVLAVATRWRNEAWASDVSLWDDAASKSPAKLRPFVNLGTALSVAGHPELGVRPLRRAVDLDPASAYARAQLAACLLSLGRVAEAEPHLREAIRLAPDDAEATFNLATLLWRTARRDEARSWFARFLEIAPPAYAAARRVAAARANPPAPPARTP